MNRILPYLAVFLLASCASWAPKKAATSSGTGNPQKFPELTIAVGTIEIFQLPKKGRLLVGKPDMLRAELDPASGEVRLLALKRGRTSVLIQDESGRVAEVKEYEIVTHDLMERAMNVQRMLGPGTGLEVRMVDDFVVITGAVKDLDLIDRTVKIENAYQGKVVTLVTVDPALYEEKAKQMEEEIHRMGLRKVTVRRLGETYFIEGKAESSLEREMAEVVVQTLLPPIMSSPAIHQGLLITGARKYSIRNFITIPPMEAVRLPASAWHQAESCEAMDWLQPLPGLPVSPASSGTH